MRFRGLPCLFYLIGMIVLGVVMFFALRNPETMGGFRYLEGDYAKALVDFDKAVAANPGRSEALVKRCRAKLRLGDLEGAAADAGRAVAARGNLAFAHAARAEVRAAAGRAKESMEDAEIAVRLAPQSWLSYVARGAARMAAGDFRKAAADYDRALEVMRFAEKMQGQDIEVYLPRSLARRALGDLPGALADCEKAIERRGMHPDARLCRAVTLIRMGRAAEAQRDLDKYLQSSAGRRARLEAEVRWARDGYTPSFEDIAAVLASDRKAAGSVAVPPQAAPAAPPAKSSPVKTAQPAESDTGFFLRPVPKYVSLGLGILLILLYSGTYLAVTDAGRVLAGSLPFERRRQVQTLLARMKTRRVFSALLGIGVLAWHFLNKPMPNYMGLLLGAFFLDSLMRLADLRKALEAAKGK